MRHIRTPDHDPRAAYRADPPTDPWGIPAVRGHSHDDLGHGDGHQAGHDDGHPGYDAGPGFADDPEPPTGGIRVVPGPHDVATGPFPAVHRNPEPYGNPSRDLYGQVDDDPYAGSYRDPFDDGAGGPADGFADGFADDRYAEQALADDRFAPPARPATRTAALVVPVVVGIAVSVGIGVYARLHEGTGTAINLAGFSSGLAAKTWLTVVAFVFGLVQLYSALRMRGRPGAPAGPRIALVHRWSGRFAVLLTIPVAVHCLYALGYSDANFRVLAHSLLGCFFYGAFVAKMLLLGRRDAPRWAVPVLGGLVFTVLTALFLTSSVWFLRTHGLTF